MLSLVARAAALLGLPQPLGPATRWLDVGILVVWLPALIASSWLDANSERKSFGKAALRGCPGWMRWLDQRVRWVRGRQLPAFPGGHPARNRSGVHSPPAGVLLGCGGYLVLGHRGVPFGPRPPVPERSSGVAVRELLRGMRGRHRGAEGHRFVSAQTPNRSPGPPT